MARKNSSISRRRLLTGFGAQAALALVSVNSWAQTKGHSPMADDRLGKRMEPLFLSEADARAVMRDHCMRDIDAPMTGKQVEFLVSRLKPQLWLAPRKDGGGGLGETRFGGAPDLPQGAAWPLRPVAPDAGKKAAEWQEHHAWIARHVMQELPFEFVAQIDLTDAARHSAHAGLPASGRLLFFWDGAAGILESGAHTCRVIHDVTPVADLARLPIPDKFAEMEAWWRDANSGTAFDQEGTIRMFEAAGLVEAAQIIRDMPKPEQPDPNLTKPFVYPSRAKQFQPLWVLPSNGSLELSSDPELTAFADSDAAREHYSLLTGNDIGPFSSDRSNMRRTQDWLTRETRRSRLMGPAHPEQDDPRYSAVGEANLPAYPWDATALAVALRGAEDWQMLLQVSIADLANVQTEGTVYFMAHKADLAKRDFSRVVASYQQT
jgi:Domain of unknown function (DUF1963)